MQRKRLQNFNSAKNSMNHPTTTIWWICQRRRKNCTYSNCYKPSSARVCVTVFVSHTFERFLLFSDTKNGSLCYARIVQTSYYTDYLLNILFQNREEFQYWNRFSFKIARIHKSERRKGDKMIMNENGTKLKNQIKVKYLLVKKPRGRSMAQN